MLSKGLHHQFGGFPRHDLRPLGSRIHMAMLAGLVAQLPHVDLQGLDCERFQNWQ